MINQNFYLDFLIDLRSGNAEFDTACASKILGDNISRFVGGTDILLRYTNTDDRVLLLEAIGHCLDKKTPINQFYRWEVSKDYYKALEVRAEFVEPNQIVGVIIDHQINTQKLFPPITAEYLARIKSESYVVINRRGDIIENLNLKNNDLPKNVVEQAKMFLASQLNEKTVDGITMTRIYDTNHNQSQELALCILNSIATNELINELESLLSKFRAA